MTLFQRHPTTAVLMTWVGTLILLAPGRASGDSWGPLPNPPEPGVSDLLRQADLDERNPAALLAHLGDHLRFDPATFDAWIPTLRRHEHWDLTAAARKLGYGGRSDDRWVKALPGLEADLKAARLRHPARLADAILRRLEEVGTPDQIGPLLETATRPRTEWGRWKCYAAVQGILARSPTADVLKHNPVVTPVLARLLRDLPAEKRGELAAAFYRHRPHTYHGWPTTSANSSLWLAWSLSSADPAEAVSVLRLGLELPDPASRLFAGLGIARVTDGSIPYRLTANRRATEAGRAAWLKNLVPRKPDDWHFPDPLARPVIRRHRGDRVDLWWLAADGSVARRVEDVWPKVVRVLPDGTFYSRAGGLTDPDGEVMARFPGGLGTVDNSSPDGHGGFVALEENERLLVEYAPSGEKLWECPLDDGHASARDAALAGPGRILLVRYRAVQVLNRRGDVVWSVGDELDDPRWACAVDPDTVLVACTTTVELHHRTRGRIARVGGFTSVAEVRYHPTKPWVVIDGGDYAAVLQDVQRGTAVRVKLGWENWDPPAFSRWVRPAELHPED